MPGNEMKNGEERFLAHKYLYFAREQVGVLDERCKTFLMEQVVYQMRAVVFVRTHFLRISPFIFRKLLKSQLEILILSSSLYTFF